MSTCVTVCMCMNICTSMGGGEGKPERNTHNNPRAFSVVGLRKEEQDTEKGTERTQKLEHDSLI